MIVDMDERRRRRRVAVVVTLAALSATYPAGGARSQPLQLTVERLSQMGGVAPRDFPYVPGGGPTIHARFQGRKVLYAIGDGSRQATLFIFRATNCSLPKKGIIDCRDPTGPAVFIPVLWVTPASQSRSGKASPPDLVLKTRHVNSLANYVPELQDNTKAISFWIKLSNPQAGSVNELDAPALPAALVLCVPSTECQNGVQLANLADDPGQTAASPPPPAENPPPAPDVGPQPQVNPTGPTPPPVIPLPIGPGLSNPLVNPPVSPPSTEEQTPGRWLLGLFGPQSIGVGVDASASAIADAQDQILNSLTRFLDDFRVQSFKSPAADLVLMTSSDASSAFLEKNVITGTSRRPRSEKLQLDQEGDRRLAAFFSGPNSAGAEASFKSVGDMIRRYGQAAGESSGQRPPIAIYVGAARPRPDSCPEWKKMTADVAASFSSKPRVFGVVFANASAGQIDQQLGRNDRGNNVAIAAARTRVATCNGEGGSALLFVSFPDLVSHTPESMLAQAFGAVRRRAETLQN